VLPPLKQWLARAREKLRKAGEEGK